MSLSKVWNYLGSNPDKEIEAMLVLLSELESGKMAMTPQVLLRVVEALDFSLFGSGVNLFAYHTTDAQKETEEDFASQHNRMTDDWSEAWLNAAREDWLDAMAELLIKPPVDWCETVDEDFGGLFWHIAGRFPDKAVQVWSLLSSDPEFHPRLAALNELRPDS